MKRTEEAGGDTAATDACASGRNLPQKSLAFFRAWHGTERRIAAQPPFEPVPLQKSLLLKDQQTQRRRFTPSLNITSILSGGKSSSTAPVPNTG